MQWLTRVASWALSRSWGGAVLFPNGFSSFGAGLYGSRSYHAMAFSAVFACVRIISQDMAKMPWLVKVTNPDDSVDVVQNHYAARVLQRPNLWQTGFQWRQAIIVDLMLHGNSYCLIKRAINGWPVGLMHVRPERVSVYQDLEDGELFYRVSQVPGRLTSTDVLHFRGLSVDGAIGLSPLGAARQAVELGTVLETHGLNLFKRGARPGGLLKTTKPLSAKAKMNLKGQMEAAVGGGNTGRLAVLEEGMEFQAMAMNSTDAEFLANRRFQLEEICRIYGVPLNRVAEMLKSTYNNAEQVAADYVNNTLMAWCENLEATFDLWVLGGAPGYFSEFDLSALLRADSATRFKVYQTAILSGQLSPNEARAKEGLKGYKEGKKYYMPSNSLPVDMLGKKSGKSNGNPGDPGGNPADSPAPAA